MRTTFLGLMLLLVGCSGDRHGYEVTGKSVAAYVVDQPDRCFECRRVLRKVAADPNTFVQLSADPAFGKDTLHVFFEDRLIASANAATFSQLGDSKYSADGQTVFFEAKRVTEADVTTFRALDDDIAVDANNTYLRGSVIPGARGTLAYIVNGYLRDETNKIFHRQCLACPITQVDACDGATLHGGQFLRAPQAWDSQCVYHDGKRLPLTNRLSYRYLGGDWSKDSGGVYYGSEKIDGADPSTFNLLEIDDQIFGNDASGRCWFSDRPANCPAGAKPYNDRKVSLASTYSPDR